MMNKRRITDYGEVADKHSSTEDADLRQFVSFTIGEQNYCVDIMAVREIRVWTGATNLPNSASFIRGVINLRGTIVPVLDLRMRFGLGPTETSPGHVVVIVAVEGGQTGLLVDAVSDIITVNRKDIADIPHIEGEDQNPFFRGLITGQENLMALISLEEVLSYRANAAQAATAAAA